MTSSLQCLQFPSQISRPQRHAFCEEGTTWNAIKENCCFWMGQVARPHSTAHHPSDTASQSRRGRQRTGERHLIAHFLTCWLIQEILEPGARQGFPKGACNCALIDSFVFFNSLKCQLRSEICSLLQDTILEEERRKGQHGMTHVLVS